MILESIHTPLKFRIDSRIFEKMQFLAKICLFLENRQISKWPIIGRVTQNDKKKFLASQNILKYAHINFFSHIIDSYGDRLPNEPPPSQKLPKMEGIPILILFYSFVSPSL